MKPPITGGPEVHSGGTSAEGFEMAMKRVYTPEEAAEIKKQDPARRVRSQMGVEYEYMAVTIRVGPNPPNDGDGWKETKLSPIVDGEPYTLPNGMVITETVKAWMRVDGPAGY
ncbi:g8767 [Coccomyxa elongata]